MVEARTLRFLLIFSLVAVTVACGPAQARPGLASAPHSRQRAATAPESGSGAVQPRQPSSAPSDQRAPSAQVASSLSDAEAALKSGDVTRALATLQRLLTVGVDPATALYIDARVRQVIQTWPDARLVKEAMPLPIGSRIRGLIVERRVRLFVAAGREDRARQLLARRGAGLTPEERARLLAAAGHPRLIGALVPLSGALRVLGREILQGMLLAAGLVGRPAPHAATILVQDSARDPAGGAAALARAGVVAVVGLPSSSRARKAAPVLQRAGVVLLSGADGRGVPQLGSRILRGVHAPPVRAQALARWLAATGKISRVAVVHPVGGYGTHTSAAFVKEAKRRGLTVVGQVAYPRGDAALYKRFLPLAAKQPQAVFVADSAVQLEIVAPQLGLAGLQAAPLSQVVRARRGGPSKVLLLSTAEGVSDRLVKNVSHAVAGAILAPGFYPDPADPALASFVKAYQQSFGRPPSRYAALGYLSVLRIRSLMIRRARGRQSLRSALVSTTLGVKHRFDADGERVDPPRLYRIRNGSITRITGGSPP